MSVAGSQATLKGNTHQRGAPKHGFTCILHLAGVDTRHKKRLNVECHFESSLVTVQARLLNRFLLALPLKFVRSKKQTNNN